MERVLSLGAAVMAIEAGQTAAAATACASLLESDPDDAEARLVLGLALGLGGDAAGAAGVLDRLARPGGEHPGHAVASLMREHGRAVEEQLAACLALAPDDAGLRRELVEVALEAGIGLADAGEIGPAMAAFRRVLAVAPGTAAAWANLGMLLKVEGDFAAAIAACDRAVGLAPDDPQIRLNRAVALLRGGRMAEAWGDYEARLRLPGRALLPAAGMLPVISTLAAGGLRGRRVLLTHEEGFGDSLQFLRYAPLLVGLGAEVMVWAPAPLVRLLRGVGCFARVVGPGEALPEWDFHCPVFSLPRVFETSLADIPPPLAYRAEARRADYFAAGMPRGRRVGLVWAGQARPWLPGFDVLDGRRSLALARLGALGAVAGVAWVSLQLGGDVGKAAFPLHDPMGEVADFADTAAVIAGLDAVVGVDTAVVHLAASMGKPVLLLDRYDNCWRWLAGRVDSPWYPRLRIFRQPAFGDWDGAIGGVVAALGGAG